MSRDRCRNQIFTFKSPCGRCGRHKSAHQGNGRQESVSVWSGSPSWAHQIPPIEAKPFESKIVTRAGETSDGQATEEYRHALYGWKARAFKGSRPIPPRNRVAGKTNNARTS